ncbi:MAG: ferredoxin [Chloroflexi bacterium B3_Chlor]|nr:MAG: ferredoxin [Chloroflexi bacterium B3_Chlor]
MVQEHLVIFQPSGSRGYIKEGDTLKEASRQLGVDIETICGEKATCGKCKVRIEEGFFERYGVDSRMEHLSPIEGREKKFFDKHEELAGHRLACVTRVYGDVLLFVPEESRAGKQVVRKSARDIPIEINPAVRKYYVELTPATLEDSLGDWERLQDELKARFQLSNLTIDYQVLLGMQEVIREGDWRLTVAVWMDREVIKIEPGLQEHSYGLAVDIGTTTVAGYLCELRTGELLATESMMNPQVSFGEDVMSRITYAITNEDGLDRMNSAIIEGLNSIARGITAQVDLTPGDICDVTIVGNTAMHHIFLNIYPEYLGKAPFPPALHASLDLKGRDLGLEVSAGAYVHVLPIEAGFVGADNVGVLIAEEPYNQDEMVLIIDIGTNGELVLGNREKLISSSCATGPAFEGAHMQYGMRAAPGAIEKIKIDAETKEVFFKIIGKEEWNTELEEVNAKGICGSGIIDAVANMFRAGVLQKNGRFSKDLDTARLRVDEEGPEFVIAWSNETSIGKDITISLADVRGVQLAKGAMYTGAKLMMRRLGTDKLDKVILAGAFGSYIDKESAMIMGLFPDCDLENIYAVGNAAGDGARMALLNREKRVEANQIAREVEYVELTVEEGFERDFAEAMYFPHMKDRFPHLKDLLPERVSRS